MCSVTLMRQLQLFAKQNFPLHAFWPLRCGLLACLMALTAPSAAVGTVGAAAVEQHVEMLQLQLQQKQQLRHGNNNTLT